MKSFGIFILVLILGLGLGIAAFLLLPAKTDQTETQVEVVRLFSPAPNSIITSPLTLTGEARGYWYFEASFPVRVLDANGNELGAHYLMATSEWMTTEMVPFSGEISFKPSATDTGFLVLQKDNPSGLPEHDQEVRYPIRFR